MTPDGGPTTGTAQHPEMRAASRIGRVAVAIGAVMFLCVLTAPSSAAADRPSNEQLLESLLTAGEVAQLTASGGLPRPASWPEQCNDYGNRIICQRGFDATSNEPIPGVYAVSWFNDSESAKGQFRGEQRFDMRHPSSRTLPSASDTRSIVFSQEFGYSQVEALEVRGRLMVRARCWGSPATTSADQIGECAKRGLDAQWKKLDQRIPSVLPPGAPSFVTAQRNGRRVDVSWVIPQRDGGDPEITYVVTSTPESKSCTTTSTSCEVSPLDPDREYTFTVRAQNSAGASEQVTSAVARRVVLPSKAVRKVVARPTSDGVRVSWKRPARQKGAPVLYYRVTSDPESQECDTPRTRCDFTNLTPGKSYAFEVVAINAAGESRAVSTSKVLVPRPQAIPNPQSQPSPEATPAPTPSPTSPSDKPIPVFS